jgi:hypothetical protein
MSLRVTRDYIANQKNGLMVDVDKAVLLLESFEISVNDDNMTFL